MPIKIAVKSALIALEIYDIDEVMRKDVDRQYKKLALKYHPDKNDDTSALEKFQTIGAAKEFLDEQFNNLNSQSLVISNLELSPENTDDNTNPCGLNDYDYDALNDLFSWVKENSGILNQLWLLRNGDQCLKTSIKSSLANQLSLVAEQTKIEIFDILTEDNVNINSDDSDYNYLRKRLESLSHKLTIIPQEKIDILNKAFEEISERIGEHEFKCGVKGVRHLLFTASGGVEINFSKFEAKPEDSSSGITIKKTTKKNVPNVIANINETINDKNMDPITKMNTILNYSNTKPSIARRSDTTEFLNGIKEILISTQNTTYRNSI